MPVERRDPGRWLRGEQGCGSDTTVRRAVCGRTARTVRRGRAPGNRGLLPLSLLMGSAGSTGFVFFYLPFQESPDVADPVRGVGGADLRAPRI